MIVGSEKLCGQPPIIAYSRKPTVSEWREACYLIAGRASDHALRSDYDIHSECRAFYIFGYPASALGEFQAKGLELRIGRDEHCAAAGVAMRPLQDEWLVGVADILHD